MKHYLKLLTLLLMGTEVPSKSLLIWLLYVEKVSQGGGVFRGEDLLSHGTLSEASTLLSIAN